MTYDTGGADIKAGGVMAGMSKDAFNMGLSMHVLTLLLHFSQDIPLTRG